MEYHLILRLTTDSKCFYYSQTYLINISLVCSREEEATAGVSVAFAEGVSRICVELNKCYFTVYGDDFSSACSQNLTAIVTSSQLCRYIMITTATKLIRTGKACENLVASIHSAY